MNNFFHQSFGYNYKPTPQNLHQINYKNNSQNIPPTNYKNNQQNIPLINSKNNPQNFPPINYENNPQNFPLTNSKNNPQNFPPINYENNPQNIAKFPPYNMPKKQNNNIEFNPDTATKPDFQKKHTKKKNLKFDSDTPIFEFNGIKLYQDDLLILLLIYFLYKENVTDSLLYIALIALLIF